MRGIYLVRKRNLFLFLKVLDLIFSCFKKKSSSLRVVKRILLAHPAHLGDIIMATSVLAPLKKKFPGVEIDWLCASWSKESLENHPLVNQLILLDHPKISRKNISLIKKVLLYLKQRRAVLRTIKKRRYDLAIDLYMYFPNFAFLLWQSGISVRVGFSSGGGGPLFTHPVKWTEEDRYLGESYSKLLEPLSIFENTLKNCLQRPKALAAISPPFMIFHPGAGDPKRKWRKENWTALAKLCLEHFDMPLFFTGKGEEEKKEIESICKDFVERVHLLIDLSWGQLLSYVSEAKMIVCCDTSLSHVAAAYETPSTVLYAGIVNPKERSPSYSFSASLMEPLPCAPCLNKHGCPEMSCIQNISPEMVFKSIKKGLCNAG